MKRATSNVLCVVVFVTLSLAASVVRADGFDGQRMVPAAGAAGGLMVERPVVPRHLGWGAGAFFGYALNPVVLRDDASGDIVAKPLAHALSLDLLGSIGLFNYLELAVHLPLHVGWISDEDSGGAGAATSALSAGGGLGDLRLVPKFAYWLGGSPTLNFSIGAALPLSFPTGNDDELRGAGGVTIEPRLLFAMGAARWAISASFGFQARIGELSPDYAGSTEITYGLAGTFGLLTGEVPLDLQLELVGSGLPSAEALSGDDAPGGVKSPLELLGGVILFPHPSWSVYAAVGPGLTRGLGTPDVRFVAGVRFTRRVPGRDRYSDKDGDRIPDWRDDCVDEPEDYDGWQDDDGCPERDNDFDGVLDDADECPTQAEERGGDGDGCPDKGRVIISRGKVVVFGKVRFKSGSSEIQQNSNQLLDELGKAFREHPEVGNISIEGHTDSVGGDEMNLKLSGERAESVKRALVERGVAEDRLTAKGFGETRPIAPNDTPAGRARNRRVEFKASWKK